MFESSRTEDFKILIVEDHAQTLELMVAFLSDRFPDIVTAASGEEALAAVAAHRPDLVLLDIMLPVVDGFEVCRRLKADPATREIAVVMVTGLAGPEHIARAVEAGADDFLTKPINRAELLLRVRSLLRLHHLRRELEDTLALMERLRTHHDLPGATPKDKDESTP